MLIKFNEEQTMIRDMVREFTKNEVEPRDYYMDQNDAFDRELYAKFNELGLGGVLVPEEYGGMGSDYVTSTIIVHELAKGSASFALAVEISHVAAEMITNWGTEEQKKAYLPRVANGDLFAFGLTEASAGSDAAGIRSVAVKNPCQDQSRSRGKGHLRIYYPQGDSGPCNRKAREEDGYARLQHLCTFLRQHPASCRRSSRTRGNWLQDRNVRSRRRPYQLRCYRNRTLPACYGYRKEVCK